MKAIKAGRLIDGLSRESLADMAVLIDGDKIVDVRPAAALSLSDNISVTDYQDYTLLPGLVDCHVHLTLTGAESPLAQVQQSTDADLYEAACQNALVMLAAGITTVRDCGARGDLGFRLKRDSASGTLKGPRVLATGRPITSIKGHFWYVGVETANADDFRRVIGEQRDAGGDFVKVMASGGGVTPGTNPRHAQFSVEELAVMADEAAKRGMVVTAHAHSVDAIRNCAQAGLQGLEHCSFLGETGNPAIDEDALQSLLESGMEVSPTLAADYFLMHSGAASTLSGAGQSKTAYLDAKMNVVRRLREAGVPMVAGSDARIPNSPPDALLKEIELLGEVGFAAMQVIQMATSKAAQHLGMAGQVGALSIGHYADFLVVEGNPLDDLSVLRNVQAVWKGGEVV
jgi:imidazolonepropionase-like amidohydrolase